ncbi:MAG: hypothetical protein UR69_C0002G0110 [Candidatus Moranbacteria bacterium GW2011_GWE2_35_2-]|nr:MAG: hypothetical protein UR69_C0002G0110 [Candidatus Moranbacteria bacterium GW2011_GWE2_35_2-]KKQ04370.1 MAG: hypothetical protein US15_C0058G0002 [Candidatus Moranbacteria bacterium GW2011_GWF1_36_4]KKQ22540.1 MAG: hypothetical protein US37_C0002G0165 [Candidatus Moranbacteria bacterium GW2011_GWF2_37_11]KKQ29609.1 MAG: hypothetical protein US44_C0001G0201 [Candidatus Moranbacteria bacterium GW2011_GWD1_37_17]KKQ30520.1 MAG: hypothetical protein US47_C0002G0110 [Candidatus Moranbacteria b
MDLLKHKKAVEQREYYKDNYSRNMHNDVLIQWQGPEYENYPKDKRWYMITSFVLVVIIAYALITNSPLMAITFILIGIVGFVYLQRDPQICTYAITSRGVIVEKELYDFEDIKSFWIMYKEPHQRILSLHTEGMLIPYVHIPMHQKDPDQIREILLEFIPEKRQFPSAIDTLERLLHI